MKWMVNQSLSKTGKALQRIALEVPTTDQLKKVDARQAVEQMPIGKLNPNQFKVGERKSRRLAFEAARKGDWLTAAENVKAAALNTQITAEIYKALKQLKDDVKFVAQANSKEGQTTLNKAGKTFLKAFDELNDVFSFNRSKKNLSVRGSYAKWVEKMVKEGTGNFQINPELSDPRKSYYDNTYLQARTIANRMRVIVHSAKFEVTAKEARDAFSLDQKRKSLASTSSSIVL